MVSFVGIFSSINKGTYKDDLVAANQDFLQLDSLITQDLNSDFIITFETVSLAPEVVCSDDTTNNSVQVTSDLNSVNLRVNGNTQALAVSGLVLGLNVLTIRCSAIGDYSVDANGGGFVSFALNGQFELTHFAKRGGLYGDINMHSFIINGETFNLNEANGVAFFGDAESTGTRNTSHEDDLFYINNTMIVRNG